MREKLELSQRQFATKSDLGIDALQQNEQGRRVPSGAASTLLRVVGTDPEAVTQA
jgi:DNA-binding transcriptional regulator YiaG